MLWSSLLKFAIQLNEHVRGYGFLSFAKNMSNNTVTMFLIVPRNIQQMHQKVFQIKQFKNQQKQLVI